MSSIKVFSFFSGLGFLDLGFSNAGFDIALVSDINNAFLYAHQYSREHLNASHPEYGYINSDVRDFLTQKKIDEAISKQKANNLVGFIGGPPCPDFSFAGKNEGGSGSNGVLSQIYVELINSKMPDFFVFENVRGLVQTNKHRVFFDGLKQSLREHGYRLFESLENALNYNVPQYRDRLFLIGVNEERIKPNSNDFAFDNINRGHLQDILNLPWPDTDNLMLNMARECPQGIRRDLTVEYWFRKNKVLEHANSGDFFRPKETTNKFHTVQEGNTHGKSFKRLHRWRFSPTAAYGNNEVHLHPYEARRISIAEALSIQSLPDNFILPDNIPLSTKFKMVSNGVPYLMAYTIARNLFVWLNNNCT